MKNSLLVLFMLICVNTVFAQNEYYDVVYLKNGSVIKGFYKELYTNDSLRMKTMDGGMLICAFSDVERIAKEKTQMYILKENPQQTFKPVYRSRGYMGFVDYGYCVNTDDDNLMSTVLSTVHGYQFNPYIYLGAGVSYSHSVYNTNEVKYEIKKNSTALLGDVRITMLPTAISPFINLRGGYSIMGLKSWYADPSVGVDFCLTPHFGLTAAVGYRYRKYSYINEETNQPAHWRMHDVFLNVGLHF